MTVTIERPTRRRLRAVSPCWACRLLDRPLTGAEHDVLPVLSRRWYPLCSACLARWAAAGSVAAVRPIC